MRKKLLFISVLIVFSTTIKAQYSFSPAKIINKYQIFNELSYDSIHIQNTGSDTLYLKWKLILNDTSNATFFDFCASGNCFIGVPDSGSFPPILPGGFGFAGCHFWTGNITQTSSCKILVYKASAPLSSDTLNYFLHAVEKMNFVENIEAKNLILSPNPADDFIYISFDKNDDPNFEIELYNLPGNLIHKDFSNSGLYHFNTQELSPGVYFIRVIQKDKILSKRLIIKSN